jgi:hypothetical protein
MRIGEMQSFFSAIGSEYEGEAGYDALAGDWLYNGDFFSWPAQYGLAQGTVRSKGLWLGCKNFYDTHEARTLSVKVVGSGPRDFTDRPNQIFEQEIKLVGRQNHSLVTVDGRSASALDTTDVLDQIDGAMPADRMIIVRFNTSIGVSVTKKVLAFSQQNHDNYFIYDYVFKNTGIIDGAGTVYSQTLQDFWIYFLHRYAFGGESSSGWNRGWGAWSSTWGENTVNHTFGEDPTAPDFDQRAFYSWYHPHQSRPVTFDEDWGCPNQLGDGAMSSAKYAGCVTLHADIGAANKADDPYQPKTTWFLGSDINITLANVSQYDEAYMQDKYDAMSEGHPDKPHDEYVGNDYTSSYSDPRRNGFGGTSQGQGFGPYTLAPGDSIRVVFAEGVAGLDRAKNKEVGGNWLQYYKGTGTPALVMPDGSSTTDHNAYKKAWVMTGKDSILQTYENAAANYQSAYAIPQPPPSPSFFTVQSMDDRIRLTWANNAVVWPHFNGYAVYRSEGRNAGPNAVYGKIFECDAAAAAHTFDDVTVVNNVDYIYYIQSKDDGTQNDVEPGKPLTSSPFWTMTNQPAYLPWTCSLTVTGSIGAPMTCTLSGASAGTDGYEAALDVISPPPGQSYYAYFSLPAFPWYLSRDTRHWDSPYTEALNWTLKVVNADEIGTTITWNTSDLPPQGSFTLTGSGNLDMRTHNSISFTGNKTLTIQYRSVTSVQYTFPQAGWYLVSLPVIPPADSSVSVLFPAALGGSAFAWNAASGAYETVSKMAPKKGYWLAFPDAASCSVSGFALTGYTEHFPVQGWYMIGSVLGSTVFNNPNDNPDGLVYSPAFKWDNASCNYVRTAKLNEKEGYWAAVFGACDLTVGSASGGSPKSFATADWQSFFEIYGNAPPAPPPASPGLDGKERVIPSAYGLSQNYPNPFNPETTIEYQIPKAEHVTLVIYNTIGQAVRRLVDREHAPGYYRVAWDGRDENGATIQSGIYLAKIEAGKFKSVKKLVFTR